MCRQFDESLKKISVANQTTGTVKDILQSCVYSGRYTDSRNGGRMKAELMKENEDAKMKNLQGQIAT